MLGIENLKDGIWQVVIVARFRFKLYHAVLVGILDDSLIAVFKVLEKDSELVS